MAINAKANVSVIITVPHDTCIESIYHLCDIKAYALAKKIHDKFIADGIDVMLLRGDINRTLVDLNRFPSRDTAFRRRLRKEVSMRWRAMMQQTPMEQWSRQLTHQQGDSGERKIFLLDCHSYDKGFETQEVPDPEFIILYDTDCEIQYILSLYKSLVNKGIRVNLLKGKGNDIIDEFTCMKNIIPVLLEISEKHYTDKLADEISDVIKNWVYISY